MKVYVQFLTTDLKGRLTEAIGSDGVYILDGRNKLRTQKNDAMVRMHRLRSVHPEYIGYRIYKGERFANDNFLVAEWIRSGAKYSREVKL